MAAAPNSFERIDPPVQWKWFALAMFGLAAVYLALLNPYWVPSGDGDVYTAIGRSLARGEDFRFNGVKAAIAPPGWPVVLALAMKYVTPEFWFLKSITISCMLASLGFAFFILRRFVSDKHAAGLILLAGTLAPVYPLTFWMHTEALFCLLTMPALLLCFRIAEGKSNWGGVAMVAVLLVGATLVRWPGPLHVLLVGAILARAGRNLFRDVKPLATLVLAVLACGVTFKLTQDYLALTKQERLQARAAGAMEDRGDEGVTGPTTSESGTTLPVDVSATQSTTDQAPTTAEIIARGSDDDQTPSVLNFNKDRGPVAEYSSRIASAGQWFSWLIWYPTRFGLSIAPINYTAHAVGWGVIVLLGVTLVSRVSRGDFFWIGLALYTGGLCVLWPNPNARYFVPVAPFILLGVVLGIDQLKQMLAGRSGSRFVAMLLPLFVGSVIVTNLSLLTIDLMVFRSGDQFYKKYEAGANEDLITIAQEIRQLPAHQRERIAVSERYINLGSSKYSKFGVRAMHLLLDEPVIGVPRRDRLSRRPSADSDLDKWAFGVGVDVYIYQAPSIPWRLWHFKLPPNLQAKLSKGKAPTIESGGWELYRWRKRRGLVNDPIATEPATLPTRVPGM
jgi:hypothetical protein